ncbi:hypothetical protein [Streptomyces sp. MMS24-I29]|uniref:hypothetical protein n=1 Tax=Streptomyces sp. MMS24-I29 TaxID=3351480 RepID=UPI003C7BA6D7
MNASSTPRNAPDELTPETTYDLIICNGDRIAFHDHYENPQFRLRMCIKLLTSAGTFAGVIDAARAARVHELYESRTEHWTSAPDSVVDEAAKLCRRWGVQIYVSTTRKKSAAPAVLYSVTTEYGPDQSVAEHFPDRESRTASLIERAEHFFAAPGHIPAIVLSDEQRLAALVTTFLMPATVTLGESVLDETTGIYRSASR